MIDYALDDLNNREFASRPCVPDEGWAEYGIAVAPIHPDQAARDTQRLLVIDVALPRFVLRVKDSFSSQDVTEGRLVAMERAGK